MAAVGVVVVASFATVAFDHWARAVAASFVVVGGFVLVVLVIPSRHVAGDRRDLGVALGASGSSPSSSASTAAASSAPSAGRRCSPPTARRAPARPWPRSGRAWRASCTTAWGTRSTWSCSTRARRSAIIEKKPELAREALESIETAGRQALGDIERMLGILRAPDEGRRCDVTPGMGQLETLCDAGPRGRAAGGAHRGRRGPAAAGEPRPDRVPDRAGVADQHAQARRQDARERARAPTRSRRSPSRCWTRARA